MKTVDENQLCSLGQRVKPAGSNRVTKLSIVRYCNFLLVAFLLVILASSCPVLGQNTNNRSPTLDQWLRDPQLASDRVSGQEQRARLIKEARSDFEAMMLPALRGIAAEVSRDRRVTIGDEQVAQSNPGISAELVEADGHSAWEFTSELESGELEMSFFGLVRGDAVFSFWTYTVVNATQEWHSEELTRYQPGAGAEPVALGRADRAVFEWYEEEGKNQYGVVTWMRGTEVAHVVQVRIDAPDGKDRKTYAMDLARQIDAILEENGFYNYPDGGAVVPSEPVELVLFDANPVFSDDAKTFAQDLGAVELSAAPERIGTTADGVSQLILRAELDRDVPVHFALAGPDDGTVEPLLGGRNIAEGGKYYAFALYTPPAQFLPPPDIENKPKSPLVPPAQRLGDALEIRDVPLTVTVGDSDQRQSLVLAQPPVVLVHGLFSDPVQTWVMTGESGASMAAVLERAGFLPFLVNYQDTNGNEKVGSWMQDDTSNPPSALRANAGVLWDTPRKDHSPVEYEGWFGFAEEPIRAALERPDQVRIGGISQALAYYRDELDLAATQAIVIGHSMGGILARVWASDGDGGYNPDYRRPENFMQGDIDRLVTLNSPHHGSELVELKDAFLKAKVEGEEWQTWLTRQAVNTVLWWFLEPERGAVHDLRPASRELQQIGETRVPAFAIATHYEEGDAGEPKNDPLLLYQTLYGVTGTIFFENRPLLDNFVRNRAAGWRDAPKGVRQEKTWDGKTGLDFADLDAVERYRQTFARSLDENIEFWTAMHSPSYRDGVETAERNTFILPFGLIDWSMGDDDEFHMLDLRYVYDNGLMVQDPLPAEDSEKQDKERLRFFMSMLRGLVFQNDPRNDGAVRVASQIGDLAERSTEVVEHVIHSYSPWDYRVQTRLISLLRYETDRFADKFPAAGRALPRYLAATELADARAFGSEAIAWSGMVPAHALQFLDAVDRNDAFVLARPVNPAAARLLRTNAAAKGMNVKGKSANWGPQIGLIPVRQRFSKIWRVVKDPARRRAEIDKYDKETLSSINTPYPPDPDRRFAQPEPLRGVASSQGPCDVLTIPEIDEAEAAVVLYCGGAFFLWQNGSRDGKQIFDPAAPLKAADLSPEQKKSALANPMMVLADDTSDLVPRPYLTADYDLLAIGFRFEPWQCESGSTPEPGKASRCLPAPSKAVAAAKFDKLRGYIGPRQWRLISEINDAVRDNTGYTGGLVTHHGPENQYAKSPYVDYPVLVFDPMDPNIVGDAQAYVILQGPPGFRDIHLKRFFAEKNRAGYNLWPNRDSKAWRWTERRPYDMDLGYDPRDAANLPPYVEEAPRPDTDTVAAVDDELTGGGKQRVETKSSDDMAAAAPAPASKPGGEPDEKSGEITEKAGDDALATLLYDIGAEEPDPDPPAGLGFTRRLTFAAARSGNAQAQMEVAGLYEFGIGVAQDPAQAFAWTVKAARAGSAEAIYDIGQAYWLGRYDLPKDQARALRWYVEAADRGSAPAMTAASAAYLFGLGTAPDAALARHWLEKAAAEGYASAQYRLGIALLEGDPGFVTADPKAGLVQLSYAADQGYAPAQVALGRALSDGKLIEPDYATARIWLERAARYGASSAQVLLGDLDRFGRGSPVDYASAERWYRKAGDNGDSDGFYRLGLLQRIIEYDMKEPPKASIDAMVAAAEMGHVDAALWLGEGYVFGPIEPRDDSRAARYLAIAAEAGNGRALSILGLIHETGEGVEQSYEKAAEYYRLGAEKREPLGLTGFGSLKRYGLGTERDLAGAAELFRQAAEQDYRTAQFYLGEAYRDGLGVEQDLVLAYQWFALAAAQEIKGAGEARDAVAARLSPAELNLAKQMTVAWTNANR